MLISPGMLRAPCVRGAHTSPHCWGSSPRELQRPGEQVGGDVETYGQAPAPSPAPASSAPTALVWRGLLLAASPLTCYQHSPPANIALSLIPLTSSPGAKPCAQAGLLPRGKQKLREGAGSPLAQTPLPPKPPALPLTSWGTSPKLLHCLGLFSFLYHRVR